MDESTVLNKIIATRRSIFPHNYTGARIDDNIIKKILENANWAPTHRLTEPWRFIIYTGEGLKKLASLQATLYRNVTQADGTFKEERYQNLLIKPMQSSHIIVVAMKRDESNSVPEVEEIGAVFCALQNMHLTATAYNVGAYLSTGGITYFKEANEIFGLGKNDRIIGFFNLGMLKPNLLIEGKRKPINEKITWCDSL